MNFLNPLALAFALLAVPIILLYLLRLQRREQNVSSTLLWKQVTMDREANTLWQKLRRNLLLILQLITLAFFIFALVRPYVNLPGAASGHSILMLDASASMQATDVQPSRFEAARAQARELINSLGTNDQMTLIVVDGSPRALSTQTNDKPQLLDALASAQPTLDAANWSAAIALAAATGANTPDNTTIVISDGANAEDLKLLPGRTRFIPVGNSGDNMAMSTLSLRRTVRGLAAFARVSNTGAQDNSVLVSLRADGSLVDARTINVPAGKSVEWTVNNVNPNAINVQATIDEAARNVLKIDDAAYAVNAANTTRQALLLTRGNRFLEQALSTLPGLRVTRAITPPIGTAGAQPYDLYVLDGLPMALPPQANVMLIGAQSVFSTSGIFSNTAYVRLESHPLTRQLDWRPVNVLDSRRVNAPNWLNPLIESAGGPLLFAGQSVDESLGRVVVLPFDLRRSDLPLQIAFPVLMANVVDWLAPPQGVNVPASVRPGEVVPLPQGAQVTLPTGQTVATNPRGFAQTTQTGLYRFSSQQAGGAFAGTFAVNFSNATESRITPNPNLQVGAGATATTQTPSVATSQREFWHTLALVALLVLIAEWWVYQRGVPTIGRR